jgi:hypothetical protein
MKNETLSPDVRALLNGWSRDYTRELGYTDPDDFYCFGNRELDIFQDDEWAIG